MMANMQEEQIALEEVIPVGTILSVARDVVKRWYLIVTVALIAAMAAYIYADMSYTPRYTASATLVVTGGSTFTTTYQNLSATTEAAGVFTEILNSSLLRQKVAEETGIVNFNGTVTANVVGGTNLLNIVVQGTNARTTYLMTRAVIEHHSVVSREVLGDTVMEVLRAPEIPTMPSNPRNPGRYVKLAAAAGMVAVIALLAMQAWTMDKIRSRAEAERKLSCRVLGELYHERKKRKLLDLLRNRKGSILIVNPLTSFAYTESIHKLSGRIDKLRRKGQRVVMVSSLLENEGKSTVAVNLALSWASKGRRVLLVDGDLRKPACHRILNLPEASGMIGILQNGEPMENHLTAVPGSSLHLIRGGKGVRNAASLVSSEAMRALLQDAASKYDLVIVDTPPMSLTPDAECIGEFAHCAVMVARQNAAETAELNEALQTLEKTGVSLVGCILNNVYGTNSFAPAFYGGSYGYGKYGYHKYGYYKYGYYKYGYGRDHRKHTPDTDGEKGV